MCRKARTFDEIVANSIAASHSHHVLHRRNNSTIGINVDGPDRYDLADGYLLGAEAGLRKTKSAESVLCHNNPRIIVNESFDRELGLALEGETLGGTDRGEKSFEEDFASEEKELLEDHGSNSVEKRQRNASGCRERSDSKVSYAGWCSFLARLILLVFLTSLSVLK